MRKYKKIGDKGLTWPCGPIMGLLGLCGGGCECGDGCDPGGP